MATSPLGGFADLSRYQLAAAQPTQNPLDALIQGYNQGQQLQQLPQIQAEQVLARQLQNALMAQRLKDLQNPEAALARKIQEELTVKAALNPELGIVATPAGLAGQTIFSPGATNQTEATLQQVLSTNPQTALPTAAPAALPETPISLFGVPTGLNTNPNIPAQATETKISNQIRLANARAAANGEPVEYFTQLDGTVGIRPKRITAGVAPVATTLRTATGEAAKEQPKPTKGSAGSIVMTPNQQNLTLRRASEAGVDVDDPKYFNDATQTYDFTKITIDGGKAARENKRLENAAKAGALSGKSKTDIEALNAAEKQLHSLQDEITEIANSGKTPGFFDNVIAASTAAPPEGALSAIYQQLAKGLQSDESKLLEDKKSIISSSLVKAISGLAVSKQEAARLGFVPRAGDSFEELIRKAAGVQNYINNQRAGLSEGSEIPSPITNSNAQNPIQIKSIRLK